jgi:hypothetical protein
MRITLDASYPGIIGECAAAMRLILPDNRVHIQGRRSSNCVDVGVSSKRLPEVFPQHGAGPKHQRSITLVDWQTNVIRDHLRALVRGLIHADGCRFTNLVRVNGKSYRYPRYTFTNASADIRRIFCDACDELGVEWKQMNPRNISVARRASVELLDGFVGPKA